MFKFKNFNKHTFHLVTVSPWPIMVSFSALILTLGAVMYFNSYKYGSFICPIGLLCVIFYKFL